MFRVKECEDGLVRENEIERISGRGRGAEKIRMLDLKRQIRTELLQNGRYFQKVRKNILDNALQLGYIFFCVA